jgi:VRR-NUC domain-containing protein
MTEAELIYEVRKEFSRGDCRLFRNNVGTYEDRAGNWVSYGLAVGASDLIGFKRHIIVPRDVGSEVAIFTALECKGPRGRVTAPQQAFIDMVLAAGGTAGVVKSVADAHRLLCY